MICSICDDFMEEESIITLQCSHRFCKICMKSIISVAINNYNVSGVRCSDLQCYKPLSEPFALQLIDSICSTADKRKYLKILQDRIIVEGKTMIMCPNKSCQNVISFKQKNNRQTVNCTNCKMNFCSECRLSEHENKMCLVDRNDNLKEFHKNKLIKACPTCKTPVEKESGCNHISCIFCGKPFCWLCGRKYTEFHYSIYNFILGCPGMENVNQSAYIKAKLKMFAGFLLFLSFVVGTYAVFQLFVSFVYFVIETIPGSMVCVLAYCLLKQNFTKMNLILIQLVVYPHRYYTAIFLGLLFLFIFTLVIASTVYSFVKKKSKSKPLTHNSRFEEKRK